MSSRSLLRQLRRLERVFAAGELGDYWIDIVKWEGKKGGAFGHAHWRFSPSRCEQQIIPCSDEEEVEVMRQHYEREKHRFFGQGEELSFPDYLERFCYLGSEELGERRNAVIGKVRSDGEVSL